MTEGKKSPRDIADYEVGFGRPPVQHQFVKGRSGNPRGRPKAKPPTVGVTSLLELADKVASRKITMNIDGKAHQMSVLEAILMKTQQMALAGKQDAVRTLIALHTKFEPHRKPGPEQNMMDLSRMDANEASKAYIRFMSQKW